MLCSFAKHIRGLDGLFFVHFMSIFHEVIVIKAQVQLQLHDVVCYKAIGQKILNCYAYLMEHGANFCLKITIQVVVVTTSNTVKDFKLFKHAY